jgi:hypothetical protein
MGMLLFGLNLVSMTMALSALFTDSKISTQIGTFILLLPATLMFYVLISILTESIVSILALRPYYGE